MVSSSKTSWIFLNECVCVTFVYEFFVIENDNDNGQNAAINNHNHPVLPQVRPDNVLQHVVQNNHNHPDIGADVDHPDIGADVENQPPNVNNGNTSICNFVI